MTTIAITFDAQALSRVDFNRIVHGGTVIAASSLLNLRWEDFSALDAAREIGLQDVTWEATRDDTPGTLTCVIRYDIPALPGLQERLLAAPILEYEVNAG